MAERTQSLLISVSPELPVTVTVIEKRESFTSRSHGDCRVSVKCLLFLLSLSESVSLASLKVNRYFILANHSEVSSLA